MASDYNIARLLVQNQRAECASLRESLTIVGQFCDEILIPKLEQMWEEERFAKAIASDLKRTRRINKRKAVKRGE